MKRKFLEDLGIANETIDKILDENSIDIGKAKGELEKVQKQNEEQKQELDNLKAQIKERNSQLEELKKSTGDVEELKKQIEGLQEQNKLQEKEHQEKIKQIQIENAVETALNNAKSKNNTAVKALLKDLDKAELNEDGTVKGLKEQIDNLVKGENTSFLFNLETTQKIKGAKPAETGKEEVDAKVDLKTMTYDERASYFNEHPEIKV